MSCTCAQFVFHGAVPSGGSVAYSFIDWWIKGAEDHPHPLGHNQLCLLDPSSKESGSNGNNNKSNNSLTEQHRTQLALLMLDSTQIFSGALSAPFSLCVCVFVHKGVDPHVGFIKSL